jgi:hypothetical protein
VFGPLLVAENGQIETGVQEFGRGESVAIAAGTRFDRVGGSEVVLDEECPTGSKRRFDVREPIDGAKKTAFRPVPVAISSARPSGASPVWSSSTDDGSGFCGYSPDRNRSSQSLIGETEGRA